jgi:hypothetical protein
VKRFELLASSDRARAEPCRAWDHVFQRAAALKRFQPGLSACGTGAKLFEAWERWLTAPHTAFLRPAILDFSRGWLVREWASGFSLLDLIRQRGKVEPGECLALLRAVPEALDHAVAHGLPAVSDLDKIFVHFYTAEAGSLTGRIDSWPPWAVRIEPLRIGHYLPRDEYLTEPPPIVGASGAPPAVEALYRLIRELSGGSRNRPDAPLIGFGDAANRILGLALDPGAFKCAQDFFDALVAACAGFAKAAPRSFARMGHDYTIPAQLRGEATPGELLNLQPANEKARPMRLVCREEYRFGRSPILSDLVACFCEKPGEKEGDAEERATFVSRVHTRAQLSENGIRLYDGTDSTPSRNGTFIGAGEVSQKEGLPLRGLSAIQFGPQWRATLLPVPSHLEAPAFRDGGDSPSAAAGSASRDAIRWGALFTLPWPGSRAAVDTVWLIEDAGFGADLTGGFVWDTEALNPSPASFRSRGGAFFLQNRRLKNVEITVNSCALPPGTGAPLRDGARLRIGSAEWAIRIH